MSATLQFDVSGLPLRLEGVPGRLARDLATKWPAFEVPGPGADPFLTVVVRAAAPREDPAPFTGKRTRSEVTGDAAIFRMDEGEARVPPSGAVEVDLVATTEGKQLYALINLIMMAFAWRLPARGGLLLHAAGIVLDGRAFVLVGAEGAGKSTWARLAAEAGATVLSDDVVLLDRAGGRVWALSSPFRAPELGALATGRWPVAALLGAHHAVVAALREESPMRTRARLAANVPYAVDGLAQYGALAQAIEGVLAEVPSRVLEFGRDGSFVGVLRGFRG